MIGSSACCPGWIATTLPSEGTFYGTPDGLFLSAQCGADSFGEGMLLLDASVTGPVEGPVWVTAQKDVAFYCSPGREGKLGAVRRLWMVRF